METNLGNVVGLIRSASPPASKPYVLWGKIVDANFPLVCVLHAYKGTGDPALDTNWESIKTPSSFKGALHIVDTPTEDGEYLPIDAGTYPNFGGLTFSPATTDAGKQVRFIKEGGNYSKSTILMPAGQSTYEAYVETTSDNPVKTKAQWVLSLVGAKGDTGLPGATGDKGDTGLTGATGAAGANGADADPNDTYLIMLSPEDEDLADDTERIGFVATFEFQVLNFQTAVYQAPPYTRANSVTTELHRFNTTDILMCTSVIATDKNNSTSNGVIEPNPNVIEIGDRVFFYTPANGQGGVSTPAKNLQAVLTILKS